MPTIINGSSPSITFSDSTTQATALPAQGTAGNVLTSNGTAWVSSAPSGSPLVFLQTSNVTSAVSSITFSSLDASTYISYMVSFEGIGPSVGDNRLELNLGTNSGIISSDYYGTVVASKSSSTSYPTFSNSNSDSTIYLSHPNFNIRTDSVGGVSGNAWISNINNNSPPNVRAQIDYYNSNLSEFYNCFSCYSIILGSQTITQLRVRFATGNIAKGRLTIYGLKAS